MAESWAVSKYKNICNKSTERNPAGGDEGGEGFETLCILLNFTSAPCGK
jgi:hypothetical protein